MINFLRIAPLAVGLALAPVVAAHAAPPARHVMVQPRMMTPGMMTPGMMTPGMMTPGMMTPSMMTPRMLTTGMMTPGMMTPSMMTPGMMTPGMMTPSMMTPRMTTPGLLPFIPFNSGLGSLGGGAMYNPYAGYASGSYGGGGSSSGSSYGGGGSSGGGSQNYSSGSANPYQQYAAAASLMANGQQASPTSAAGNVLESFGVPLEKGKPAWPLGLRILAPASETGVLRRQVDALVALSATQAGGQVPSGVVQEAGRAVTRLRTLLAGQEDGMAAATYQQAAGFLKKLQGALKALS
jgi:hypothetical protein